MPWEYFPEKYFAELNAGRMEKLIIYYILRNLNFLDLSLWLHLPRIIKLLKNNLKIKEHLTNNDIIFCFGYKSLKIFVSLL